MLDMFFWFGIGFLFVSVVVILMLAAILRELREIRKTEK